MRNVITKRSNITVSVTFGLRYSRMDQLKFVEDSLLKI